MLWFGVVGWFSTGVGTPSSLGYFEWLFWAMLKYQAIRRPTLTASLGVLHFFNVDDASLGIVYGAVTKGSNDSAATVGVGYLELQRG